MAFLPVVRLLASYVRTRWLFLLNLTKIETSRNLCSRNAVAYKLLDLVYVLHGAERIDNGIKTDTIWTKSR
jgi:hypothetical protein